MLISWIVLASAVTAGLLTTLVADNDLPPAMKLMVLTTTFLAWAGGIATARLINPAPARPHRQPKRASTGV